MKGTTHEEKNDTDGEKTTVTDANQHRLFCSPLDRDMRCYFLVGAFREAILLLYYWQTGRPRRPQRKKHGRPAATEGADSAAAGCRLLHQQRGSHAPPRLRPPLARRRLGPCSSRTAQPSISPCELMSNCRLIFSIH